MSLNDLHHVRELRRRQGYLFEDIAPAARRRKILIYSMDPWQLGVFEQFLHLAFLRKGHEPVSVFYDGVLPLCAWENASVASPPLKTITDRFAFIYDCFGIEAKGISQFIDAKSSERRARNLIYDAPDQNLVGLVYESIPVGRIALRDLFQYTLGAFDPQTEDDFALFRRHLIHAVMSVDLARAFLQAERPDTVILVNGKSIMYSYMYEVARAAGVHVVTWEEGMYFDNSVVLAHNNRAIDFPVETADWNDTQRLRIDESILRHVDEYFSSWRNQTATAYVYYDNEERDFERICSNLDISRSQRIVSIFSNIVWDTNALDKDHAFRGMTDWIFATIDILRNQDRILIVRAHPAEARWEFKTRTPVRSLIEKQFGEIPGHVRIVDGLSELSSYEIARHSDRCAVYTSTLGIEFTLAGLQPLICGVPFYARKGFTNDIADRAKYEQFLLGQSEPHAADAQLLRRFMHLVLTRLVKRPEFFVGIHKTPQQPRIRIDTFEGFPESMPCFDEIVDCILTRRSFTAPKRVTQPCPA